MRRSHYISFAIVLAGVALALFLQRPRMLPLRQCSDVYRQYCQTEGIVATFIKNFDLGDSTAVDVTVLKATDSVAWKLLMSDFKISSDYSKIPANIIPTGSRLFPKGHPDQTADTVLTNNELLVHYRQEKTLYIFHFENEAQFDAIFLYKHNRQKKQSSKLIE